MTDHINSKVAILYIIACLFIVFNISFPAQAVVHEEEAAIHHEAAHEEHAEEATVHGEAAHEEHAEHAVPIGDLWKRAINFVILAGALYYVLRKPAKQFFSNRTESIKRTLEELERQKNEAENKYEEYRQKLLALEKEKGKIIQDFINEGEAEKAKIIEKANLTATHMKQEADVAIQQEIKNAKKVIREEIAELSAKMAEDLLKKHIKDSDQQRLVDEYLAKVVEAK